MKSVICSITLIASLSVGNSLFAQGRGAGGGPPAGAGQSRQAAGPATAGRPADVGTPNRPTQATDRTANPKTKANRGPAENHVGRQISDNPALASHLKGLLPQGTNLDTASNGFKNMGQFVAAVHVSNNLNIPFDQLKAKMVADHQSMGDAIRALKPDLSKSAAKAETKKAESQAKKDKETAKS